MTTTMQKPQINGEVPVLDAEPVHAPVETPSLPALLSDEFVTQFERGVERYKRWVAACYRLTTESHWINNGTAERPRFSLQGPGAEALMNPMVITFPEPTVRREDKRDGRGDFYCYWVEGPMVSKALGRSGWYVGYADSRDPFFTARPGWDPATGEGDVLKSAFTNWEVNSVSRLAGIRDPDPAILRAAGLDPARIRQVDYSGRKTPERDQEVISEAQSKRLWAIARGSGWTAEAVKGLLGSFGIERTEEIRRAQYDELCTIVSKPPEKGGSA